MFFFQKIALLAKLRDEVATMRCHATKDNNEACDRACAEHLRRLHDEHIAPKMHGGAGEQYQR